MRYFIFSLLLLCAVCCTSDNNQQRLIQSISNEIADSKPAASASTGTLAEYRASTSHLELKIADELPLYNGEHGLETAIRELVDRNDSEIKMLGGAAAEGLSGNSVFVLGPKDSPYTIVKVFTAGGGDFVEELLALTTFKDIHLKGFTVPAVQAIGNTKAAEKQHLLIAEDYATGLLLSKIMEALLWLPGGSNERKDKLEELIAIHRHLGRALAELHTAGNPLTRDMQPAFYDYYLYQADKGTKAIIETDPSNRKLAEETLEIFRHLLQERGPRPYGFTHGDAHQGNYIWDKSAQRLTIIDVTDGGASIGKYRQPIGNPMIDVSRIVTDFSAWNLWGLTPEERRIPQTGILVRVS